METCENCGAALPPGLEWCGQCYTRVPERRVPDVILVPDLGGPRRLETLEKLLFGALLIAVGVTAFMKLANDAGPVGSASWAIVAMFLGIYTAVGIVGLWLAWRPEPSRGAERRPEHEVVIGGTVIRVPDVATRARRT